MKHRFIFSIFIIFLCSCSLGGSAPSPNNSLIEKLKNQGPTALSADNPFIAPNLLLSKEIENSTVMKGFVEHRGSPAALEVEQGYFSPLFIHFYYMDKREMYSFEKVEDIWVIKGPFEIESDKMTQVRLETRGTRDPAVVPNKTNEDSQVKVAKKEITKKDEDPVISALNRIEEQRKKAAIEQGWKSEASEPSTEKKTSIAEAIKSLQSESTEDLAQFNKKGDVIHTVTSENENLEVLAFWYTHDKGNAGRIKRMNKLLSNALDIGTEIRIPSYLLKHKSKLNPEDIDKVQEIME